MAGDIVLVVADTLSAFNMGCYGYDKNTTPFLDSLVEENFIVKYGYSNAPWTVPSHASLFTGDLPCDHGTTSQSVSFDSVSLAEKMKEEGYDTVGITNNPLISPEIGFDRGFDEFLFGEDIGIKGKDLGALNHILEEERKDNYDSSLEKYFDFLTEVVRRKDVNSLFYGLEYIKSKISENRKVRIKDDSGAKLTNKLAKERFENSEDDLFLFLNYMEPHEPYEPPSEHGEKFLDDYEAAQNQYLEEVHSNSSLDTLNRQTGEELENNIISLYDAEINYLDTKLEEFWNILNENSEDFVLIIVGDHGENIGHYGMWDHQYGIWERLVRVPIIIAGNDIPEKMLEEKVSLRDLHDYILGDKKLSDLGKETAYSEYYGCDGFYKNFGGKDPSEMASKYGEMVYNKSRMIVSGEKGLIENTVADDFIFAESMDSFSEESKEELEIKPLRKLLHKRIEAPNLKDIDI
jgi:arylsulfatase A-like enzyme